MKTLIKSIFMLLIVSMAFTACKKSKNEKPVGPLGSSFPDVLNTIVTPAILDSLEKHGLTVHDGLTPPTANGIYLLSPNETLYDNTNEYYVGKIIDDYKYKFSNQNSSAFTIQVDYKDVSANNNTGSDNTATFISGAGNSFTVFAQIQGQLNGVNYTTLELYSGVIASTGVENFQYAIYLKSKTGDTGNTVVAPVGTIRIFKDEDGLSASQSTFSISEKQIQSIGQKQLGSILSAAKH